MRRDPYARGDERVGDGHRRRCDAALADRTGETPFRSLATVLANKHKLSIVWELDCGGKRFIELERALAPVTPKVLTRNLRDLEAMLLVTRRAFEGSRRVEYALSPLGVALRPSLVSLCHWAYDNRSALTLETSGAES